MTQFLVDSALVASQAIAAQGSAATIQAEVSRLHSQLQGLQEHWQGSAATAFQTLLADWTATQRRVEESLADITKALQAAGRQYAEVEQSNLSLFSR